MSFPSDHLFWSYRLAKFEVAGERRGVGRLSFARFEQKLADELRLLAARAYSPKTLFRGLDPGKVWVRPKAIVRPQAAQDGSSFVTVPEHAHDHQIASMTVRVLLEPSPEFATCEIIWLRAFGPALDTMLSPGCLGSRLDLKDDPPAIPISGRRAYQYWAPAYRQFRANAISTAKWCLNNGSRRCVLSTLDLTSYYDNIDPSFLLRPEFISEVGVRAAAKGVDFNPREYADATAGLLDAYGRFWAKVTRVVGVKREKGIPIGSLTARTVSNLALLELDRHVLSRPGVRYYARYVDDILAVEQPEGDNDCPPREAVSRLVPLDALRSTDTRYVLDAAALKRPGSEFIVQTSKLRVFDLNGEQGLEYLIAVEAEMQRVSSERQRFLEPWGEALDQTVVASPNAEPIRALREADALSLRKLAVGTVSDKVATAAAMLSREEARRFSRTYLGKAGRLATDWSRWVDLIDVSLRILGSALVSGDKETANEVIGAILTRSASLEDGNGDGFKVCWGVSELSSDGARKKLREWVEEQLVEVICGATPFETSGFTIDGVEALVAGVRLRERTLGTRALLTRARLLAEADLRLADRETDQIIGTPRSAMAAPHLLAIQAELSTDPEFLRRAPGIEEFLDACRAISDPIYGRAMAVELLLVSRPPTYVDVLFRWLRAERDVDALLGLVNAVRGTRYRSIPMTHAENRILVSPPRGTSDSSGEVGGTKIVLGNLCTDESWWAPSLTNPVLTFERQRRLARVINEAIYAAKRAHGRPTLLVLPELSLPRRWLRQVCAHLSRSEPALSLVAGLEYDVIGNSVYNEAIAFVPRPFFSAAGWIWTKRRPAHHEGPELVRHAHSFATRGASRRFDVMWTEHGAFIPLICSELLEVDTRSRLLGKVDLVLVPAWNQDTTSFESLVHSAALELHCFIAVANNGVFSDCRVRGPFSEGWQREVCRLNSRGENEIVSAELPVGLLREYREDPRTYGMKRKAWLAESEGSGSKDKCPWPQWKPAPPSDEWPRS
ncbi:MAG: hypothetical protein Q8P18_05850 [Pseudomonadota bacterium]|nr:hypothetical protein [Pseudomonadota bacterium]